MKLPVTERLLCCADMVPCGSIAADVGTDHGYLGIYLVQQGICPRVIASDLRVKPLQKAKQNAALFHAADKMEFVLSDGLHNIEPGSFDTLICAGMGGDCMALILDAAPWLHDARYTLVLQPQTSGNDLRRYLAEHGYAIEKEQPVRDGRFLYTVMRVRAGAMQLTAGEQYVSPALFSCGDALVVPYMQRIERSLIKTIAGIAKGTSEDDRRKHGEYAAALREIQEMREQYDNR